MSSELDYLAKISTRPWAVVEDTNDPMRLGRVRVRVHGPHTDSLKEIPTKDLPWSPVRVAPNTIRMFSPLYEGAKVDIEYKDGISGQAPVVIGYYHGLVQKDWDRTRGFSPQSDDPIKLDKPAGIPSYEDMMISMGPAASGDAANTSSNTTNGSLEHGCDFRWFFTLPRLDIGLPELADAITQLKDAWKKGKNSAMLVMRGIIKIINTQLRKVLDAILAALGFDPTGILSGTYSLGKMIIRDIADLLKEIAEYVETVSLFYNIVANINVIINYLKSLPAQILAMVKACLEQFVSSIQNLLNVIKTIPGLASTGLDALFAELGVTSEEALTAARGNPSYIASANVTIDTMSANSHTDLVTILLYDTTVDHANLINSFISTNFANAEVIMANMAANTYNPNLLQTP